jgi:hypothetical protein
MLSRLFIAPLLAAVVFIAGKASAADAAPVAATVLEPGIVCLRTSRVPEDFANAVQNAQPTNKYSGLVLDLRFADGDTNVSTGNFPAGKKVPLVILVNGQTQGAAADLAVKLRADGRAIIIGDANASGKIKPDITVNVAAEDEKRYLENPFAKPAEKSAGNSSSGDMLPFIDHTSEAELVRRHVKDGDDVAADTPRNEPAQPVIRDPALARAVDLLKALAALHQPRG